MLNLNRVTKKLLSKLIYNKNNKYEIEMFKSRRSGSWPFHKGLCEVFWLDQDQKNVLNVLNRRMSYIVVDIMK